MEREDLPDCSTSSWLPSAVFASLLCMPDTESSAPAFNARIFLPVADYKRADDSAPQQQVLRILRLKENQESRHEINQG